MANENMFIAAAVWLTGMLGFFVFLFWYARNDTFKKAALIGCFGTLMVSMEMLRRGWQNFVVNNQLADITEQVFGVFTVLMVLAVGVLALSVMLDGYNYILNSVRGERNGKQKADLRF